jgi:hypothetical protein
MRRILTALSLALAVLAGPLATPEPAAASHIVVTANQWSQPINFNVGGTTCTAVIRMGTYGDGYAEVRWEDSDCSTATGVRVQTNYFGQLNWVPAGCSYRASAGGYGPLGCDHTHNNGSRTVTSHIPGEAFYGKLNICVWNGSCAVWYFGLIPH